MKTGSSKSGGSANGGRNQLPAPEFVQAQARALWLTMSNYKTIRSNIEGALDEGEYELAALQARFGLQIGIRSVIARRGLYYVDKGPFEVMRTYFAEDDPVRVKGFALDRSNPMTKEEVVAYCGDCHHFVETICGVTASALTDAVSRDDQIEAAIGLMEDVTGLADHLNVHLPWPGEDVVILRMLRSKLKNAQQKAAQGSA